jgi:hypothetical protein
MEGTSYWEDWDFLDGKGLPTGKIGTSWMVRDFLLRRLGLLGW